MTYPNRIKETNKLKQIRYRDIKSYTERERKRHIEREIERERAR